MTSIIYNFVWGMSFVPSSLERHQKYLLLKQLQSSKLKLKNVQEELRLQKEKEQSWITLIKARKINRKKPLIKELK